MLAAGRTASPDIAASRTLDFLGFLLDGVLREIAPLFFFFKENAYRDSLKWEDTISERADLDTRIRYLGSVASSSPPGALVESGGN